jgi:hypothetical protein
MSMPTTLDLRTGPDREEIVLDGADGRHASFVAATAVVGMVLLGVGAALLPSGWGLALLVAVLAVLALVGVWVLGRRARVYRLHLDPDGLVLVDGRDVVRVPWSQLAPVRDDLGCVRLCWGDPGAERRCVELGEGLEPEDRRRLVARIEARRRGRLTA